MLTWLRRRKTAASATVLAVLIATPVTIAVLHQGFPISDVDLSARDVWVTNGPKLLTGRLNMQIAELNGAATMATRSFDVMQNGTDVFVYDADLDSIERIDPSYVSLGQKIAVPHGSEVSYGGSVITILRPSDGALWIVPADGELQFDPEATEPIMQLGPNARAVATEDGAVYAVSPDDGILYRIDSPGAVPTQKTTVEVDDYDLTAVGDRAVILDRSTNSIIKDDGGRIELPAEAIRLQQRGPAEDFVVVATGDSLLRVDWSGGVKELDADVSNPATSEAGVSAPVVLGTCIHGAWSSSARYLGVCEGRDATVSDIPGSTPSSELVFRVNRSVIALNNLIDGNVWLVTQSMRLVENWEEVTPPDLNEGEQGEEKASQQTFAETLANRTEQNQRPHVRMTPEHQLGEKLHVRQRTGWHQQIDGRHQQQRQGSHQKQNRHRARRRNRRATKPCRDPQPGDDHQQCMLKLQRVPAAPEHDLVIDHPLDPGNHRPRPDESAQRQEGRDSTQKSAQPQRLGQKALWPGGQQRPQHRKTQAGTKGPDRDKKQRLFEYRNVVVEHRIGVRKERRDTHQRRPQRRQPKATPAQPGQSGRA